MDTPPNIAQSNKKTEEIIPVDPKRVRAFAIFFKRYMSISSLVVASLPIPVTALHIVPTFSAQTKLLSVYTSLFCFLILGFVFYSRHQLARRMFPEYFGHRNVSVPAPFANLKIRFVTGGSFFVGLLPLLFIVASIISVFQYNDVLNLNVQEISTRLPVSNAGEPNHATFPYILANTELNEIKYGSRLMVLYIAIFVTAEAAFIMMAMKEYLQDLVGLTEMDLIRGPKRHAKSVE